MPSGAPVAVAANLVASALAVLLLAFVRIPPPTQYSVGQTTKRLGLGEDLRSGVRHILARPPLVWLLVLFALCNLVGGAMGTLQPLIVGHNLLADRTARALSFEASLALLASVMSVGGLIGSLAMTLWG
jgi:hypothetical protein